MTQNLLNKTLRWYIIFAAGILLITAPIFYLVTQHLYIDEANETLRLRKREFLHYHLPKIRIESIENWNRYNRDEKIIERKYNRKKDKFATVVQYDTLSHEHEPYRILMSPITIEGKPFTFLAKINLVEREDLIQSIAILFFGLITAMLIGLYFITRLMSAKLWRPFYNALNHLEKFEVDKSQTLQLSKTNISEFDRLNHSIEELISKNTLIYNNQKEFIENAAHELQTPLAVIQGKVEALFQQSNLSQNQSEILEKLSEAITRMARLNKNLLLLSRLDYDQFSERENISLTDFLKKNFEFFVEQSSAKNIQITMNSLEDVNMHANPVLTEVLLNNLFLNAIRHNIQGGRIVISLTAKSLSISNTGSNSPLPDEKIFERFSKINPSTQGTGLGLAIVKRIVAQNNWKIQYSYMTNLHHFIIEF